MAANPTTRVLVKARPESGAIDLAHRPIASLEADHALVKIRRAGICGTDLHIVRWNDWAARSYRLPVPLGHEFCGEIVEQRAANSRFRVGDRVVAETHLPCGQCLQCRSGRGHICANLKVFSKLGNGCFADYTVVPLALLRAVPEGVLDHIACIMEPLGIAVRAAEPVAMAADMLVTGCGPIGLMIVMVARALGAGRIFVSDPSSERRSLALSVGADVAIDPVADSVVDNVRAATAGNGVDISIDASGNERAIGAALAATQSGGTLLLTGLPEAPVAIDLARQVILREVTLKGLYGRCIDTTWLQMERLLRANRIDFAPLLTHNYRLGDYRAAFDTAASGQAGKVLLQP